MSRMRAASMRVQKQEGNVSEPQREWHPPPRHHCVTAWTSHRALMMRSPGSRHGSLFALAKLQGAIGSVHNLDARLALLYSEVPSARGGEKKSNSSSSGRRFDGAYDGPGWRSVTQPTIVG
jgi:hypothetical protein